MPNGDIPNNLIEAIANSTAMSVGEQPAILANLALANQIANTNIAQQNALSNQQAMFHLELTIVSKCVEMIASINPAGGSATQQLAAFQAIMEMFAKMNPAHTAVAQPAPQPQQSQTPPQTTDLTPATGSKGSGKTRRAGKKAGTK